MSNEYNYIIFGLVLIIIAYFYRIYHEKKVKIDLDNINNEDFINYEKLIKENNILKILRIIYFLRWLCLFVSMFLFIKFVAMNIFIFVLIFVLFSIISYFIKALYTRIYKNQVIVKIFNSNSNITYCANGGISKDDYKFANFEKFGKYKTSDLIEGSIEGINFIISSVTTYREIYEKVHYIVPKSFDGVVAKLALNYSIDSFLYIVRDAKRYDKNYLVLIDDSNFSKKYSVFSNNKELTKKIVNPNIVNYILDLEKSTGIYFEAKLSNDVMYFRFLVGNLFVPNIYNIKKDVLSIIRYKLFLNYIEITMTHFIKALNNYNN